MLNELSNDPIQAAIARLEKQHEEDKQGNSGVAREGARGEWTINSNRFTFKNANLQTLGLFYNKQFG